MIGGSLQLQLQLSTAFTDAADREGIDLEEYQAVVAEMNPLQPGAKMWQGHLAQLTQEWQQKQEQAQLGQGWQRRRSCQPQRWLSWHSSRWTPAAGSSSRILPARRLLSCRRRRHRW